jgi:hypothetical protein
MPMNPAMPMGMMPMKRPVMAGKMPVNPLMAARRPGGMKKGGATKRMKSGGETFESDTAKRGRREQDINTMSKMNSGLGSGNYDAYGDALDVKDYTTTGKQTGGGGLKKGGMAHRASERADGCCEKGHTKGKIVMCKGGMYK